jgi:hypothetical protein
MSVECCIECRRTAAAACSPGRAAGEGRGDHGRAGDGNGEGAAGEGQAEGRGGTGADGGLVGVCVVGAGRGRVGGEGQQGTGDVNACASVSRAACKCGAACGHNASLRAGAAFSLHMLHRRKWRRWELDTGRLGSSSAGLKHNTEPLSWANKRGARYVCCTVSNCPQLT